MSKLKKTKGVYVTIGKYEGFSDETGYFPKGSEKQERLYLGSVKPDERTMETIKKEIEKLNNENKQDKQLKRKLK